MAGRGTVRSTARCGQRAPSVRKMRPQAFRSAEAPIRHCRPNHPSAQLILENPADNPSRSRHREARAGGSFFPASGRGAVGLICPCQPTRRVNSATLRLCFCLRGADARLGPPRITCRSPPTTITLQTKSISKRVLIVQNERALTRDVGLPFDLRHDGPDLGCR